MALNRSPVGARFALPPGLSLSLLASLQAAAVNAPKIMRLASLEWLPYVGSGLARDGLSGMAAAPRCWREPVSRFQQVAVDQSNNQARHFNLQHAFEKVVVTLAPMRNKALCVLKTARRESREAIQRERLLPWRSPAFLTQLLALP